MIGAVVPTVAGREDSLQRALNSLPLGVSIFIVRDRATCGEAWNEGVQVLLARGCSHLLLFADDLRAWPYALARAREACELGYLPAPLLYNADGTRWDQEGPPSTKVSFPRVPFLPRWLAEDMFPIPPLHYYSDVWVGTVASSKGWQMRVCAGYRFTHTWAEPGRVLDSEPDRILYEREAARL